MSTVSCAYPNKPGDDADVHYLVPPRIAMHGMPKFMWVIGTILVAINVAFNKEQTGFTVIIPAQNVLLALGCTLLLSKGLRDSIWPLVVPWVWLSIYQCYTLQYKDLLKMYHVFFQIRKGSMLLAAMICYLFVTVLRLQLIIKVVSLTISQWYSKRLRTELLSNH